MSSRSGVGLRREILSLRFTPRQIEMIERLAEEQQISVSSLLRRAVGLYVFEHDGVQFAEGNARPPYRRRKKVEA